ncbi:Cysteine dioxygenase [Stieleria neptunia]|uniref:Cysteine dioxygenase n=2 Tax=Stieleria neptunia TaxID=2527979 RepID=A0A518HUS1_9BACT|nr:Cysteine dioxygenase [Stieleria neptunia]
MRPGPFPRAKRSVPRVPIRTQRLRLSREDLGDYIAFQPRQFSCQLRYRAPHFEVNRFCWLGGQRSSIHGHRGSVCCVRVVEGTLTDTDFVRKPNGRSDEISRRRLVPGQFVTRAGSKIHRCGNEDSPGYELVSLHLYSPPLAPLSERVYGEAR